MLPSSDAGRAVVHSVDLLFDKELFEKYAKTSQLAVAENGENTERRPDKILTLEEASGEEKVMNEYSSSNNDNSSSSNNFSNFSSNNANFLIAGTIPFQIDHMDSGKPGKKSIESAALSSTPGEIAIEGQSKDVDACSSEPHESASVASADWEGLMKIEKEITEPSQVPAYEVAANSHSRSHADSSSNNNDSTISTGALIGQHCETSEIGLPAEALDDRSMDVEKRTSRETDQLDAVKESEKEAEKESQKEVEISSEVQATHVAPTEEEIPEIEPTCALVSMESLELDPHSSTRTGADAGRKVSVLNQPAISLEGIEKGIDMDIEDLISQ